MQTYRSVLIGAYAGGVRAFQALFPHSDIAFVITPSTRCGDQLAAVAERHGILVWRGPYAKDPSFREDVMMHRVDILLNVQSPYQVCSELLDAPRIGSFNLHPSLLPRYAGLNPTAWALHRGEHEHGVTLHWMTPEFDAGPIAWQTAFPIRPEHTPVTLLRDSLKAGMALVTRLLTTPRHAIPRVAQDLSQREYFQSTPPGFSGWCAAESELLTGA